jgi:hypothetical protein
MAKRAPGFDCWERTLEELKHVVAFRVEQREHLRVGNPFACCHPLHIAIAESAAVAETVRVVYETLASHGDRLETTMRMLWEARNALIAVVHIPSITVPKICTDGVTAKEIRIHAHLHVARRELVEMVHRE